VPWYDGLTASRKTLRRCDLEKRLQRRLVAVFLLVASLAFLGIVVTGIVKHVQDTNAGEAYNTWFWVALLIAVSVLFVGALTLAQVFQGELTNAIYPPPLQSTRDHYLPRFEDLVHELQLQGHLSRDAAIQVMRKYMYRRDIVSGEPTNFFAWHHVDTRTFATRALRDAGLLRRPHADAPPSPSAPPQNPPPPPAAPVMPSSS
jgi:hypothetical protein